MEGKGEDWEGKGGNRGTGATSNFYRPCFLLVINSNPAGSYLAPFQRYCRFSAENSTPPLFHQNFMVFPLTQIVYVGCLRSEDPKLINRNNYFRIKPTYMATVHSNRITEQESPYCRKGTVRCRSCCFWFIVRRQV